MHFNYSNLSKCPELNVFNKMCENKIKIQNKSSWVIVTMRNSLSRLRHIFLPVLPEFRHGVVQIPCPRDVLFLSKIQPKNLRIGFHYMLPFMLNSIKV